jgi:hypothetical protein
MCRCRNSSVVSPRPLRSPTRWFEQQAQDLAQRCRTRQILEQSERIRAHQSASGSSLAFCLETRDQTTGPRYRQPEFRRNRAHRVCALHMRVVDALLPGVCCFAPLFDGTRLSPLRCRNVAQAPTLQFQLRHLRLHACDEFIVAEVDLLAQAFFPQAHIGCTSGSLATSVAYRCAARR